MKTDKAKQGWRNHFDILLLGAVAVLCALVSLLDFLGLLDGISWLANRIPTLTLLAIGLVASYLVLERRTQLESMQDDSRQRLDELSQAITQSTTTIIDSLNGVEFRRLGTGGEAVAYVNKRLSQAKRRVDDLSWSSALGLDHGLSSSQEASTRYAENVAKIADRIPYREVFMFSRPGRIEKLRARIAENRAGYSCAYYEETPVPLLQFIVIDDEEVIVLTDMLKTKFAIKQPSVVRLFSEYYEEVWRKAMPIKTGTAVNREVLTKLLSD